MTCRFRLEMSLSGRLVFDLSLEPGQRSSGSASVAVVSAAGFVVSGFVWAFLRRLCSGYCQCLCVNRTTRGVIVARGSAVVGRTGGRTVEVRYRQADGRLVETGLDRLVVGEVLGGLPVRDFRWYKGQRHYSGWYHASTVGRLVAYESRLELARVLLADFDRDVVGIATQRPPGTAERRQDEAPAGVAPTTSSPAPAATQPSTNSGTATRTTSIQPKKATQRPDETADKPSRQPTETPGLQPRPDK